MKVYILEDEILILKHLLKIVQQIAYLQVVGYAGEIKKAIKEIPELQPELILADIRLKDGDSFRLFNQIETKNLQIIFLTAYDEYAIQALNLGAFGYLLKPIDEELLLPMLDKCFREKEQQKFLQQQMQIALNHFHQTNTKQLKKIALKSQDYIEIVSVEDIMYCKSDSGYTTFFLKNGSKILVSKVLKDYESLLEPQGFLRCHQSYLVNLSFMKKYFKEGYIEMDNKEKIPVSSRKKDEVVHFLDRISKR